MGMRIPPPGFSWSFFNGSPIQGGPFSNALSLKPAQQSPLDAFTALEQWRVKAEDTEKHSARWSLAQCPLSVWIEPYPESELQAAASPEVLFAAIRQWEAALQGALTFRLVTHSGSSSPPQPEGERMADIMLIWDSQTTLGRDYEVGHTNRQVQGKRIQQATITLITQPLIDAHLSVAQRQQRLATTVLHEMGHALGLEHSDDQRDVMHHRGWRHVCLSENDIRRICTLYDEKTLL